MTQRIILAGLIPTAFEKITLNSTAVSLNGTTRAAGGSVLRMSVETANARYRDDGSAPTKVIGVVLQADTAYEFFGYNGTSALKFCGSAGAASVLNVMRYAHVGDQQL